MSLAGRLQDLLHDVLVSSPGGYGPDTPGVLADVDPALRSKILDELEDVLYGFIDGEVEWARNRDSGPLSDAEQAEISAARKAGYTESAALDLIVKLRETKDRDATIASLKAALEEAEAERDAAVALLERSKAALIETREMVVEWAGYASDYFKEKWDLEGDLARIDRFVAVLVAALNREGT